MLRFTSLARTVAVVPLRVRRDQAFGIGRKATFQLGQQWTSFSTNAKNSNHLSNTTFDSLDISDLTKAAITQELKYEYLTHVQNETLQVIMEGKDVLTKAKTGNGKTMAFLLPMIEHLIRDGRQPGTIPTLIISPTRELAHQIATEARRLTKFHRMNIACFVGGSPINRDSKALTSGAPLDILIATPGRLIDHLGQNTGNLTRKVKNLRTLVLDEADRLLDMGFRQELLKIIKHLPKERQTLLFSATLPASTEELKNVALKDDYAFVDTIDEADHQTNVQTTQHFVVCPMDKVISTVEQVLTKHMIQHPTDYKIMVFSPTARAAQFMAHLFQAAGFHEVLEMHSRKSQSARIKTSDAFRKGTNVIMFTSDVSARGVDYPDVTLVVQVGLTDRDQYIHRLGRTARAGSHGEGILVLADFEKTLLNDLSDLPLLEKDLSTDKALGRSRTEKVMYALREGSDLHKSAEQSYQAWLGFYNSHLKRLRMTKEELVEMAHSYSSMIGLRKPPKLDGRTLKKMGLYGVQGLEPGQFIERRRGQNHGGGSQSRDDAGERPYGRYRGSKSDNRREEASSHGRHGREERSPRSASGRGFGRFKEEGHSQNDRNADSNNARSHSRGRSRYGRRD